MKNIDKILKELLPLAIGLILLLLLKNEYLIAGIVILALLSSFKMSYKPGEFNLFIFGAVFGFLMEYLGNALYKLQYWEGTSIFLFPIWLPLFWGYIFVLARRIGNLIVKE